LTSVERPKEGETTEIKDSYAYNGEDLRTSQTISGTTSYLAWDMAEELPLILSDGTNSYIYGPGGLPIEQISSGGTVTYLHHDQQGSTRLLTGSTGTVTGKCTYGAYGTPTCEGASTTPLGYDAQYTSSDTGLIYMRARVYDPATAQFLTVDPLASLTGAPYFYANDNPLNASDPTGLVALLNAGNPSSLPGFCETTAEKIARAEKLERLRRILEIDTKIIEEERHEPKEESEGEQREHVIERCVGGIGVGSTESWVAKTKIITPIGALTSCAAGIYGPVLIEGIKSVLE
jgi:RHS repeat-associated protein